MASTQTKFQDIHIYDIIKPRFRDLASYERSISNDDSYESRNAELFQPDRVIFLDGTMQSNRYGNAPYHESLVQIYLSKHSTTHFSIMESSWCSLASRLNIDENRAMIVNGLAEVGIKNMHIYEQVRLC